MELLKAASEKSWEIFNTICFLPALHTVCPPKLFVVALRHKNAFLFLHASKQKMYIILQI